MRSGYQVERLPCFPQQMRDPLKVLDVAQVSVPISSGTAALLVGERHPVVPDTQIEAFGLADQSMAE